MILIALAVAVPMVCAQSSSSIKRDQKRNRQQVEQAQRSIKQNAQAVENSLSELELLEGQIADINRDVRRLRRTSDSIVALIRPLRDSINDFNARLDAMCSKYRTALHKSQTNADGMNDVAFVFSSASFRQAWQRYRSLRQFARWRRRKAGEIVETREALTVRRERLDSLRQSNNRVLRRVEQQRDLLNSKKVETDRLVKSLRSQNKQLQQVLKRRQDEARRLEERLEKALAEELEQRRRQEEREARERREREERERRQAASGDTIKAKPKAATQTTTASQADRQLTGTFESNRGKLPYPVNGQYTIVKKFGTQQHPRLPKVKTNNPGIDIETERGAAVHAVFEGEVSQIFKLAGYNNVIVVRHGDYVTVYANIESLSVRKGDKVATGQELGRVYVDKNDGNRSVLHFELRHEKEKQDPELWLRAR